MFTKPLIALSMTASLAGCVGSTTSTTTITPIGAPQFGSANADANGAISTTLTDTLTGTEIEQNGDGFGYVVGTYPDQSTVGGFAGLTPSTNLTGAVPAADVSMTGTYRVGLLSDLEIENGTVVGTTNQAGGLITLNVDANAATISGSATISGTQEQLQVFGNFNGNTMDGLVIYRGISGNLDGQIDNNRAVGTFYGGNALSVYAGGFLVDQ